MPDAAFHPGPNFRPPPKCIKQNLIHVQSSPNLNVKDINPNINFDFEENSPLKKASCPRCSKDWTNHFFRNLKN